MACLKKVRIALVCLLIAGLCEIAGALGPAGDKPADEKTIRKPTSVRQPTAEPARQPKKVDDMKSVLEARLEVARNGYKAASEHLNETKRQGNVLIYVGKPEDAYQ
ncbi:MAG TPA: hypothetical protein VHC22_06325 [Pirellulales bacterium]|nr:hypothetical protein [Pirellulales bacterium]